MLRFIYGIAFTTTGKMEGSGERRLEEGHTITRNFQIGGYFHRRMPQMHASKGTNTSKEAIS
jgi:hypothetical protein